MVHLLNAIANKYNMKIITMRTKYIGL